MATPNAVRNAQRASNIVALLEHKPGPGIYSRLERAVQGLPENVRVQELPGLLKRYKDGIPGWELNAVDLDSVVAGRTTVPRDELLAAVRERSPLFTHKETVLTDLPPRKARQTKPSPIGRGIRHGDPRFTDVSPGVEDHKEIIISEPENWRSVPNPDGSYRFEGFRPPFNNHWDAPGIPGGPMAVAHARAGRSGDALRIQEIQSDIANHNMKAAPDEKIDFALKDAYRELLVKRMLLEAAEKGHRAIEVADPEVISEAVGMPSDSARYLYGKVIPGEIERVGRKMGGLVEEPVSAAPKRGIPYTKTLAQARAALSKASENRSSVVDDVVMGGMPRSHFDVAARQVMPWGLDYKHYITHPDNFNDQLVANYISQQLIGNMKAMGFSDEFARQHIAKSMPRVIGALREEARGVRSVASLAGLQQAASYAIPDNVPPGRRYVISDEMRKNIITKGIPAAVAIGTATGMAGSSQQAQAGPLQAASDNAARAAMPWQTQRKIARLTKQVDAAYEAGDFKTAEKLDVQREQLVDDWDNRLEDLDEGDGDVDLEDDDPQGSVDDDMEPNDYEGAARNYEEQMRDIYGSYVAGGPHFQTEAELANALRGIGPDTEKASLASDADLIREAKAVFGDRQAQIERVKSGSPEDGVRAMQAQLRDMPAGLVAAPIMAQAQGVNERRELPTGSGGTTEDLARGVVGENDFSMGISPAEWNAHAQRMQADGPSMEQQKFQRNVTEVLGQPIIRVGAAKQELVVAQGTGVSLVDGEDFDRITPAKFVGEYLDVYGGPMDDDARAQVMERVAGRLAGTDQTPDYMADDIIDRMMGALKESSPQGKYANMDPMPQEQLDALKQQHGDWAESMLTPGSAENFEALRGYELLRTTLDGQHAPVYADNMSNAMTFVSGFADGDSRRDFHELAFSPGPEGRFSRANRDYFRSRTREDEPAAFRDQDGTSRFASTGMNNIQGLVRAGGDMSTTVGKMSWPLFDTFADFSRTNLGQALNGQNVDSSDWNFQQARHQAFDREQPILPAGMSREMFDWQRQGHMKDREEGLAWGATTYPNVQQAFDNITGSKTQKTWGPPVYNDYGPNFLQNTVGNIPSAAIMASAAATGGVAGLAAGAFKPAGSTVRSLVNAGMGLGRGAAKGVGAAVASQGADLPFDTATDFGIGSTLAGPSNYFSYMGTPEQENALLPGVDPNAMSIEELNDRRDIATQKRDDLFFEQKFQWNKKQKTPEEQAYDQWRQNQ